MLNKKLHIALAQINPTVGDVGGNCARIMQICDANRDADIVIFPELAVSGYPPEDLVTRPDYLAYCAREVQRLAEYSASNGPAMLVGTPWPGKGKPYNAVALLSQGEVKAVLFKRVLPNYGVFDEKRVFEAGDESAPVEFGGVSLGVMICEDFWFPEIPSQLCSQGAELLVAINASPFNLGKPDERVEQARARVSETELPLIYVNQVGGQDELVFDGVSFALASDGTEIARLPAFQERVEQQTWTLRAGGDSSCDNQSLVPELPELASVYAAMILGLKDYVEKNGFDGVIIGLSGGIDSALTAAVAVDALGSQRVRCVMMPSPYTSGDSLEDAEKCALSLGARYDVVSIEPAMRAYDEMLGELFADRLADVTEENVQSRARALLLMAMSNKFGWMLLTTGNKSEMAMGYATLYGDMCGGYSVLKDVYKTTVFDLARWRNVNFPDGAAGPKGEVIPVRIITKPPSAELRPDQKDSDSLPPYEELDGILKCLIEGDLGVTQTVTQGFAPVTVQRVARLLALSEYKRRQAPPGVKITRRAFSLERRYPITNRFKEKQ